MPNTSQPCRVASFTTPEMTLLIPGAGPPPQTIAITFLIPIDKDEQAARFKARESTPHKRFKITEEDWRNRDKWDDYLKAVADMFAHTDTSYAPWYIISTNDKQQARFEVLRAILKQLKADRDTD